MDKAKLIFLNGLGFGLMFGFIATAMHGLVGVGALFGGIGVGWWSARQLNKEKVKSDEP